MRIRGWSGWLSAGSEEDGKVGVLFIHGLTSGRSLISPSQSLKTLSQWVGESQI
jgi:hypothetical protein